LSDRSIVEVIEAVNRKNFRCQYLPIGKFLLEPRDEERSSVLSPRPREFLKSLPQQSLLALFEHGKLLPRISEKRITQEKQLDELIYEIGWSMRFDITAFDMGCVSRDRR